MRKILAISIVFILCFGLSACSTPSPTEVTTNFLQAIKDKDDQAQLDTYKGEKDAEAFNFRNIFDADDSGDPFVDGLYRALGKEMTDKLLAFEYEVTNEKIDGDNATVDVTFTTYNTKEVVIKSTDKFIDDVVTMVENAKTEDDLSDAKLTDAFVKNVAAEYKTMKLDTKETVTIPLVKVDGNWKVDTMTDESEFPHTLSGGLFEGLVYLDETIAAINEQLDTL